MGSDPSQYGGELFGGMTANIDNSQMSNPPPHPNLFGGNPRFRPRRGGYLMTISNPYTTDTNAPGASGYTLGFMYNPSQISMSAQFNTQAIPAYEQAVLAPNLMGGFYVTWDMLFDRSYELAGIGGSDPTNGKGCLVDLAAGANLMGILQLGGQQPAQYLMQLVLGFTPDGSHWGFTGFLTQFDVQFLTYNKNMIPQRMTVTATLQTQYAAGSLSPGSSGAGSAGAAAPAGATNNPGDMLRALTGPAPAKLVPSQNLGSILQNLTKG